MMDRFHVPDEGPPLLTDSDAQAKGWNDLWTARMAVGTHEAGHILSHVLGGSGVREAVFRPDCTGYVVSYDPTRVRAQDFLAGLVAERLHGFHGPDRHSGVSGGDLQELDRWCELFGVDLSSREAKEAVLRAAVEELSTPLAMAQVRALRGSLLFTGRLTGEECREIIHHVEVPDA